MLLRSSIISIFINVGIMHFIHAEGYFEYLLGDLGYLGDNVFSMWRFGDGDKLRDMDPKALITYNKMHANYRVLVWGIGGLKWNS